MLRKNSLAAAIICYFPEISTMLNLLRMLAKKNGLIIVVNNGGLEDYVETISAVAKNILLLNPGSNIGMAAGLNAAFSLAADSGFSHLISFDQDSSLSEHALDILIRDFNCAEQNGKNIAAIGPRLCDPRYVLDERTFRGYESKENNAESIQERPYVITSGCLASIEAWRTSGGFEEKLFIDLVDIEWCWRLKDKGYSVYVSMQATMEHRLSDDMKVFLKRFTFNTYSPLRRFYISRNSLYLLVWMKWNCSHALHLIKSFIFSAVSAVVSDEKKLQSLKFITIGIARAICKRMGKYQENK